MAKITSVSSQGVTQPQQDSGLVYSLAAKRVLDNVVDIFDVIDRNGLTGQLLRDLIGLEFAPHAHLATMTAVAASSTAMTAVIASSTAMTAVIASSTAMTAVAASSTAMTAVAASSTAMTAVAASAVAVEAIRVNATANNTALGSSFSVGAYLDRIRIIGGATTDVTLAAQATMTAVAASSTAMTAVAASSPAMTAVAASAVALNAICKNVTAASTATAGLQSRRATIIATMNAAPTVFTRQANLQLNTVPAGGNDFDAAISTNSIIVPVHLTTTQTAFTYTLFSLANVTQISQHTSSTAISTGVALRGLRISRSYGGGNITTVSYDMYTAV